MEGEDLPFGETDHVAFQYGTLSKTGSQLKRIFEVLPRERLHIIVYDDLVRDPAAVYARLIKFLGLEHDGRMEFPAINVRVRYRVPALQQALLSVKDLRERLGIPGGLGAHKLIDRLNKRQGVPNLRPAFEAELKEYFREDVQLLSELVQRDFSDWTELKRP